MRPSLSERARHVLAWVLLLALAGLAYLTSHSVPVPLSQQLVPDGHPPAGNVPAQPSAPGNPPPQTTVTVPDLAGLRLGAAREALQAAGLVLGTATKTSSSAVPIDRVIESKPPADSRVARGTTVDVFLSVGPAIAQAIEVPNIRATYEDSAVAALTASGLRVNKTTVYDDREPTGIVIDQDPRGGQKVAAGSTVTIVVTLGSHPSPSA